MVVMAIVTVFFILLAQIQRGYAVEAQQEAEKLVEEAIEREKEAIQMKKEAENQREIAIEQAAMARKLEAELAECKKK